MPLLLVPLLLLPPLLLLLIPAAILPQWKAHSLRVAGAVSATVGDPMLLLDVSGTVSAGMREARCCCSHHL